MALASSIKSRVLSRREIEAQIANGRHIVILNDLVLKLDAWIPYHPGGEKAILHLVGRDGTDEIIAYHSEEAQALMHKFVIGRVQGKWENFLPPIQGGIFRPLHVIDDEKKEEEKVPHTKDALSSNGMLTPPSPTLQDAEKTAPQISTGCAVEPQAFSDALAVDDLARDLAAYPALDTNTQNEITAKYRRLDQKLQSEGLYQCRYLCYAQDITRCAISFLLFSTFLHYSQYALSALCLGLFWWQLVFSAHDAGHTAITHDYHIDACIGIVIADFLGGLSIGWWKQMHNVHHIVTNSPEHDPDIEHIPFFAISHRFFTTLRSSYYDRILHFDAAARFLVQYQHFLYYPLLMFGRFNLYVLAWEYLLSPKQGPRKGIAWWHRYLEVAGQVFFWYWFGYQTVYLRVPTWTARIVFVLVSHMVTAPLHVQLTLSHFAMSTVDLGVTESFAQKMVRTTMDIDCPTWLDWFHGGLQFQVVHHLFPRIPRHNLRWGQKYVQEFCDDVGIPYVRYGFARGNKEVLGKLSEVAAQLHVLEQCRKVAARDLIEGHDRH